MVRAQVTETEKSKGRVHIHVTVTRNDFVCMSLGLFNKLKILNMINLKCSLAPYLLPFLFTSL